MIELFDNLQKFGASTIDVIWFPLLIWSTVASLVFLVLRTQKTINPLYQYHIRVATILALPIGLISAVGLQLFSTSSSSSPLSSSIFVVKNPLPAVNYSFEVNSVTSSINWLDINFIIGFVSTMFIVIALLLLARLFISYYQLKKLHNSLTTESLTNTEYTNGVKEDSVSVAFHSHPLVPFTFGWKHPIIVLPERIKSNPEKLHMAIQHELVHIRRGDYLLQMVISLIQSLFWFHPLIRIGSREIETYREISCDQEVLNTSDIQPKKYANLLLELIPLNKEFGSFAVSMAVKKSTLKQRIETMKHHKMYKTSYKRSLLILASITLMVVAPIACSDLRGPETLSEEEILNERLSLKDFSVEINGKNVMDLKDSGTEIATQGIGALVVHPEDYGVFTLALIPFEGASLVGSIDENEIDFKVNELNVEISSTNNILKNNLSADLWVSHSINNNLVNQYLSLPDANLPPPPPPTETVTDKDVFIVVEKMPELQGGQRGIQSKVKYPEAAITAGIEGRVTVQFIVDKNGDVINPKIIRGIGGGCDEEALRVVSEAKFTPGVQRGRNVSVQMSIPIIFKL